MKTGAEIVAELEGDRDDSVIQRLDRFQKHWPTIKAALLAYEPKSALRTILHRAEIGTFPTGDEMEAARAELDQLEKLK